MTISDILSTIAQVSLEIWQLKFRFILGPDDVINDVMNTNLYKCNHNHVIHMYSKFNVDIFVLFSYHEQYSYFIYKWI